MENDGITSVETTEVADLSEDVTSEEMQEVAEPAKPEAEVTEEEAEPTSQRTEQDRAFADMRRERERLERENQLLMDALSRYFEGDDAEELSIQANAYADQRDPDDVRAEYERERDYNNLRAENENLQSELLNIEIERRMADDLRTIQSIDPTVKSLEDLGETFAKFIGAGLDAKEAYYASMVRDQKEKVYPPSAIGKVDDRKVDRDYYTSEELDNLTDEEMDANWEKVMRSMKRL